MKIVFGTTNQRKVKDLENVIKKLKKDITLLDLTDIEWNLGEIEETGTTLEENSLIKAKAIYHFLKEKNLSYPVITDDAGLFCKGINNEPGIYTGRYADDELKKNPNLPKYQCVNKLLRNLEGKNREAYYKAIVTYMKEDGTYFQEEGITEGRIAEEATGEMTRPYFYTVFIPEKKDKPFNELTEEELEDTYRYQAIQKVLKKIK